MHKVIRVMLWLVVFSFSMSLSAFGQVATGVYSYGTFDNKGFDTINVANLNVNFGIPIFSKQGRGGLNFQYGLTYDSSIWTPNTTSGTTSWQPAVQWGWTASTAGIGGELYMNVITGTCAASGGVLSTTVSSFKYVDVHNAPHNFPGSISNCYGDGNTSAFSETATDGSGYSLSVQDINTFVINDRLGRTISPALSTGPGPASITDLNGNQISTSSAGTVTDTTGTTVLTVSSTHSGSTSQTSYTYPVWLNPTSSITTASVIVHYKNYNVVTAFGCSGISEYSQAGVPLVDYVELADGQTYNFSYETTPGSSATVTGRLASITLPTQGEITYIYSGGSNGIICSDGGTAALQRSITIPSGTTWTYTRTPGSTAATTHTDVVDGMSTPNHASYDFIADIINDPGHNYYPYQRTQYQGPATGTPLLSDALCYLTAAYHGTTHTCGSTPLVTGFTFIGTTSTYDGSAVKYSTKNPNQLGISTIGTNFDFGTTATGTLLTVMDGAYVPGTSFLAGVTTSGPVSETSSTAYSYDTLSITATSGLPQHGGTPGGTSASLSRGNLNTAQTYLGGSSPYVTTMTYTNDDAGQMRQATDMNGNTTTYSYDSTDTFLMQVTLPSTGSTSHFIQYSYDVASGALKSSTDQNGNTTYYTYDNMLRPLTVAYPDGGSVTNTYSYTGSTPSLSSTVLHSSGVAMTTTTSLDGYGRVSEVATTDSPSNDLVDTSYDADGRVYSVTNPYQAGSTVCTMYYTYDALGRTKLVTQADSSTVSYVYNGNTVVVTDQVGNQRESVYDGAGRLSKVFEPDSTGSLSLETDYLYVQNPTTSAPLTYQTIIEQKGGLSSSANWRTRTFTYDLAGRLLSESVPESGTTSYSFNNGSGLCSGSLSLPCSKTDANGTVSSYSYDELGRLTGKSYSGSSIGTSTPAVSYFYDQASYNGLSITNGNGQRTGMSDATGTTSWSFDTMGRPVAVSKAIFGVTQQADFSYNFDGTINTMQDFSGSTLSYAYTSSGMPSGVTDQYGNSYASGATYNPAGQLTSLTHSLNSTSATMQRSIGYNSRFQPSSISATANGSPIQSLSLMYGSSGYNNGTISEIDNGMDATRNQTYSYDNLNRVYQGGDTTNWGEQYGYDNFGNLLSKATTVGTGYTFSVTADSHNHLSNLTYDAAGEVTTDQLGNTYTYDAEGRIVVANGSDYYYDGDGYRVAKSASSGSSLFWPGPVTGIMDVSDVTGTNFGRQIYLGSLRVWTEDISGNGKFLFQDQLGSTRIATDSNGNVQNDIDYRSFGDVVTDFATHCLPGHRPGHTGCIPVGSGGSTSSSSPSYLFTDDEDDTTDSSTYYATFRNLSPIMGRFTRPDPYDGSYNFSNPQSLNRYSYVLNNPMIFVDPTGLEPCTALNIQAGDGSDDHGNDDSTDGYTCEGGGDDGINTLPMQEEITVRADAIPWDFDPLYADASQGDNGNYFGLIPKDDALSISSTANPTPTSDKNQTCSAIASNYAKEQMATNTEAWSKGWGATLLGLLGGPWGAAGAFGGAVLNSSGTGGENATLAAETQKYSAQWQAAGCPGNLPASRFGH